MKSQAIKFNKHGEAYITYYNMKIYLKDVMKTTDSNNITIGYYDITNNISLLVYIDEDTQRACVKVPTYN